MVASRSRIPATTRPEPTCMEHFILAFKCRGLSSVSSSILFNLVFKETQLLKKLLIFLVYFIMSSLFKIADHVTFSSTNFKEDTNNREYNKNYRKFKCVHMYVY